MRDKKKLLKAGQMICTGAICELRSKQRTNFNIFLGHSHAPEVVARDSLSPTYEYQQMKKEIRAECLCIWHLCEKRIIGHLPSRIP